MSLLLACVPSEPADTGPADEEPRSFDCALGVSEGGGFTPIDGGELELWLGFQGFLLVTLTVAGDGPPATADATMALTFDDEVVSGQQPSVAFDDAGLTEPLLLFLTSNYITYYVGKSASLAVRLEGGDATCTATASVTLVDDDPCLHTGGEPICPEDTGG